MGEKVVAQSSFMMPNPVTITGRISSVTNAFVNGVSPCIFPTHDEVERVLALLEMDADDVRCAYCGGEYTEWDHFRPLVVAKKPTGYISEINNLVPACGKCNQSKGNRYWRDWIVSDAKKSPKTRGVANLADLIARLENFEKQSKPIKMDFESVVGKSKWEEHWNNCNKLHAMMKESQVLSDEIKRVLEENINLLREQDDGETL